LAAWYKSSLTCKSYDALERQISVSNSGTPPRYLPSSQEEPPYSGRMRRLISGCGVSSRRKEVVLWPQAVPGVAILYVNNQPPTSPSISPCSAETGEAM